jgi:hypothetical protein
LLNEATEDGISQISSDSKNSSKTAPVNKDEDDDDF